MRSPVNDYRDVIDKLDLDCVRRVAHNELEIAISFSYDEFPYKPIPQAVSMSISQWYTDLYLDNWELLERLCEKALATAVNMGIQQSPEWICGRGLAMAAESHALADLDLTADDFWDRALGVDMEFLGQGKAAGAGGLELGFRVAAVVDEARVVGVNMNKRIRSEQTITPADVRERAESIELDGLGIASEYLSPVDYKEIAEGLMVEFSALGLDYDDIDEVDDAVATRAENGARQLEASPKSVTGTEASQRRR